MIRRKGLAGFVGNSYYWIKGFFVPSYSVTSVAPVAPDKTFGIFSKISTAGVSILTSITSDGSGVLSSINNSQGVASKMSSQGDSMFSTINSDGQSVESDL